MYYITLQTILLYFRQNEYVIKLQINTWQILQRTETLRFVVLTQENKEYRDLIKIMGQKQDVLVMKIEEYQRRLQRLDNQKQEYRIKSGQYACRLAQYQILKQQLSKDYSLLKKQIELKIMKKDDSQEQIAVLQQKLDHLGEENVALEQQVRKKDIIIEELNFQLKKMQKKMLQNKIRVFNTMVENQQIRANSVRKPVKMKKKPQILSFIQSKTQSNTGSLNSSGSTASHSLSSKAITSVKAKLAVPPTINPYTCDHQHSHTSS